MKIAVLGYGAVAKGTLQALKNTEIEVSKILVRRDIPEIADVSTRDFDEILKDPEICLVAELMGGDEPAFTYVTAAMKAGKHVVSANKQMISHHYTELLKTAEASGVRFAFSAAAGGSIPWLANLLRFTQVDEACAVYGIMNGTTNFILDSLENEGRDFADVLKQAQELGYAEADPTADIDGLDVRAKLALSVDAAAKGELNPETIPALGIRYIKSEDIERFKELGLTCKLIGRADLSGAVSAYVEPMLFPSDSAVAQTHGAGNIITAELKQAGNMMSFRGAGAGGGPTGVAVASDICDVLKGISEFKNAKSLKTIENNTEAVVHKYYVRKGAEVTAAEMSVAQMHKEVAEAIAAGIDCFAASFAQ